MKLKEKPFNTPAGKSISVGKVITEISEFVEDEPDNLYRVVIGTDSQGKSINGKSETDYVTAIVVHRIGRGAKYYWRKKRVSEKPVLRDKIYTETTIKCG